MFDIEIVDRPARRVVGIVHRGPYNEIGGAFDKLSSVVGEQGLWPEAIEFLGVYFDNPETVAPAELRSMAGLAVGDELALPDGLEQVRLPAGRHAVLHVKGPYSGLTAAWDYLYGTWLPQSGETERAAPSCEVYRNSPSEVEEAELLTDIYAPID